MAASDPVTSLSAGLLIYDLLSNDTAVKALSNKVFPVVSEAGAVLPYICYRRSNSVTTQVKSMSGADNQAIEVVCYAETYAASVKMAEAVRAAMEGGNICYTDSDGHRLVARSISLLESEENWMDDAYMQSMVFNVRINSVAPVTPPTPVQTPTENNSNNE